MRLPDWPTHVGANLKGYAASETMPALEIPFFDPNMVVAVRQPLIDGAFGPSRQIAQWKQSRTKAAGPPTITGEKVSGRGFGLYSNGPSEWVSRSSAAPLTSTTFRGLQVREVRHQSASSGLNAKRITFTNHLRLQFR